MKDIKDIVDNINKIAKANNIILTKKILYDIQEMAILDNFRNVPIMKKIKDEIQGINLNFIIVRNNQLKEVRYYF